MSSTAGQPRNRRYIRVSQQRKTKLRWPENSIEHQNVHRRRSSSSASIYIRVYTSEADFHKPGIYGGSVRVWANAWDVFRRTPSRGGRGRRVAVNYSVVCFFSVRWDFVFFSVRVLFFERTRPAACMRPPLALFTPLLVCTLRKHSIFTRLILGQVCMYSYDTCQICPDGVYLYVCSCVRHVSGVPVHVLLRISVVFTST